MFKVYFKIL